MIQIANPIYDEAFKFLMADQKAAKVLLSALLGEGIELQKLPAKHQSRVGHILSVFSQHWIHDHDNKRLVLSEELKADPELSPIVSRLESAFADEKTRSMLVEEEAFERTLQNNLGAARAEGKAEGKAEAQLAIARNMLAIVADDTLIAAATGLSVEEVKQLRNIS